MCTFRETFIFTEIFIIFWNIYCMCLDVLLCLCFLYFYNLFYIPLSSWILWIHRMCIYCVFICAKITCRLAIHWSVQPVSRRYQIWVLNGVWDIPRYSAVPHFFWQKFWSTTKHSFVTKIVCLNTISKFFTNIRIESYVLKSWFNQISV